MKQSQSSNPIENFVYFVVAFIIAVPIILVVDVLLKRVASPLIVWAAKSAWKQVVAVKATKSKDVALKKITAPILPTPDIFKDAPNLAPMREFRLK